MQTEWRDIPGFEGRYQVSNFKGIRTASKKPKKLIQDIRGYSMVVIDDTAYYVDSLHARAFDITQPDMFNEVALQAAKSRRTSTHKSKYVIVDKQTREEFKSFSAVSKVYGFNYDKFYNTFYTNNVTEVEFEGHKFEKVYK